MQLDGMHHITMITGDAPANVAFFAGTLGLRMVKKTVNFDAPEAYHLYFGDEQGSPGTILTWFEFAGARRGKAGAGMVHTIALGVPSEASLDFWDARLGAAGVVVDRTDRPSLRFTDPDGLGLELVLTDPFNGARQAVHPDVPAEHAITGVEGARAFAPRDVERDADLLVDTLGFTRVDAGEYLLEGITREFTWGYDQATSTGIQGAGTVHHIAWHSLDEDHVAWQQRVATAGVHVTPVIDRDYFNAIYFRQPQGILFEIATTSPGFAVDESPEHLGEALRLPSQHEHLRGYLEGRLTPLVNPRSASASASAEVAS